MGKGMCVFFYEVEECLDGKSVFEVLFMSFQLYELREYEKRYVFFVYEVGCLLK